MRGAVRLAVGVGQSAGLVSIAANVTRVAKAKSGGCRQNPLHVSDSPWVDVGWAIHRLGEGHPTFAVVHQADRDGESAPRHRIERNFDMQIAVTSCTLSKLEPLKEPLGGRPMACVAVSP